MRLNRSILYKAASVAAIYALLDWLSTFPAVQMPYKVEAIWLPSGFLFAMLMRSKTREWPWLLGAGSSAGLCVNLLQGWTFAQGAALGLTNTIEVIFGAWLAWALLQGRAMDLRRVPDTMILALAAVVNGIAGGIAPVIAATATGIPMEAQFIGAVWGGSVLLSHLFIAPLILAWPEKGPERKGRIAESLGWMAAGIALTHWGLHIAQPSGLGGLLMFLPFPLLVGAALRTGQWGVSLSITAVAFTALMESSHGHSPLPVQLMTPDLVLVWVQLFLATEAASILVLASASEAHRSAEGSLLESESRYRSLVEQFPDAILLREGSRIRYANPAALGLFGVASQRDLQGRSIREFLSRGEPSSDEHTLSGIHRYSPSLRERVLRGASGKEIPVEVTDISIALNGRSPVTLDVFRDLSKRREAEIALKRSERDFQRFFDMAPMPLVLTDTEDGRVLRANPLALQLFEAEGANLAEIRTADFYAREEDRAKLRAEIQSAGRTEGLEMDALTHKGRLKRVLLSAALVSYGGKDAILAGFMDVTLRMKTEEALRQAQKLESLGLMAGGIAHDFNNLLTALIGNMDLARMNLGESGKADAHFEAMSATLRRAGDLARQMLAYAGQAQVEIRPVDLNASIRELTGLMSATMSKKITLTFDLADGLPLIEGDPVQLQQVMLNLVTNAADAVGGREGSITLSSRFDENARQVEVEVRDTGVGMSPEVRSRIFDPFFTTKASGRGLGLSSLLGILKAHDAAITVESEPGAGSSFRIRFPLPQRPPSAAVGSASGPYELSPLEGLVLLADDEADIRMTAGAQLKRLGLEVAEAEDGREALSQVERHGAKLRLIILDLSMPRMDGAEALMRIREQHPGIPVILSSGFDPSQRAPELLKQPRTWFLPKPYRLSELRKLVAEVLQNA